MKPSNTFHTITDKLFQYKIGYCICLHITLTNCHWFS